MSCTCKNFVCFCAKTTSKSFASHRDNYFAVQAIIVDEETIFTSYGIRLVLPILLRNHGYGDISCFHSIQPVWIFSKQGSNVLLHLGVFGFAFQQMAVAMGIILFLQGVRLKLKLSQCCFMVLSTFKNFCCIDEEISDEMLWTYPNSVSPLKFINVHITSTDVFH